MGEKIPTIEEFTELVKKEYLALNEAISEEEAMRYFNSEEAQSHIKSEYEDCLEDFKNGDLNVECFREGEVGKVAYCLFMMYEQSEKYFVHRGDRLGNADRNNSMKKIKDGDNMDKLRLTLEEFMDLVKKII